MKFFCKTVEHPEGEYLELEVMEAPKSDLSIAPDEKPATLEEE